MLPDKVIALDTNLLVLLIVGSTSRKYIAIHKKLKAFTVEDFDLLIDILKSAKQIAVTPHVLAETSNLITYINDPAKSEILSKFKLFIEKNPEIYVRSLDASQQREFSRLGLTDAVIMELAKTKLPVLTADLALYLAASQAGLQVENFNHIREQYWR